MEPRRQAGVCGHEAAHLLGVAGDDDHQLVAEVLHVLQQGVGPSSGGGGASSGGGSGGNGSPFENAASVIGATGVGCTAPVAAEAGPPVSAAPAEGSSEAGGPG